MASQHILEPAERASRGCASVSGSVIRPGLYKNEMGGWFEVKYSCLPSDPDYDGGLPGVGVIWGKEHWFVPARDAEQFWATFPYSVFKGCSPVSPNAELTHSGK